MFTGFDIQTSSFKSFNGGINLKNISSVNILIGKNNTGKSNVIDLINKIFNSKFGTIRKIDVCDRVLLHYINSFDELSAFVPPNNFYHRSFSKQDYDRDVVVNTLRCDVGKTYSSWLPESYSSCSSHVRRDLEIKANPAKLDQLRGIVCYNVEADRSIIPEEDEHFSKGDLYNKVKSNGQGLTNLVRHLLHSSSEMEEYRSLLIQGMNSILQPETSIEEITCRSPNDDGMYEIFIKEYDKRSYPLSSLGSGLKTVLHLVLMMDVIPQLLNQDRSRIVFTLEELENNMHPSAQRRMYHYIDDYALKHGSIFFISTHSNIPLNIYFGSEVASTYHITYNESSNIDLIDNVIGINDIIDDLGVKASDILQSNGIVWVEGPSDRIYVKRWLELAGFRDLRENYDYQFMYYGGRLLSHYTTEESDTLINLLTINRNCALMMDSDKKRDNSPLNNTKKRIISEFKDKSLCIWVTKGKEVENYLTTQDLDSIRPDSPGGIGKYQPFSDYMGTKNPDKISFARNITSIMTSESLSPYDLDAMIHKLGNEIRSWS